MKLFIACVLFALISLSFGQDCGNKLIENAHSGKGGWSGSLPFLNTPALTNANTICPSLSGQQSCCDDNWFHKFEQQWEGCRDGWKSTQDDLDETVDHQNEVRHGKDDLFNHIDSSDLDDNQKSQLKALYAQVYAASANIIAEIKAAYVPCVTSLLQFSVGFTCLACRDNGFVEGNQGPNLTEAIITLNTETCNAVSDACTPVYVLFAEFFNALEAALTQYCTLFESSSGSCENIQSFPCTDAASCKTFICDGLTDGFGETNLRIGEGDEDEDETEDENESEHQSEHQSETQAETQTETQATGKRIASELNAFFRSEIVQAFKTLPMKKRQSGNGVTATFTATGFDAVSEGAKSSLNTAAPDQNSAAQLCNWLSWF